MASPRKSRKVRKPLDIKFRVQAELLEAIDRDPEGLTRSEKIRAALWDRYGVRQVEVPR